MTENRIMTRNVLRSSLLLLLLRNNQPTCIPHFAMLLANCLVYVRASLDVTVLMKMDPASSACM